MRLQAPPPLEESRASERSAMLWSRRGIVGWWLNKTAPPRPKDLAKSVNREYVRRSELISLVSLLIAAFLLSLTGNSLSDPSTAVAVILMAISLIVSLVLNRLGRVDWAAYSIIIMMMVVIMVGLLGARGGLRLIWFVTFDLFCFPIALSAQIIHRYAPLVTGAIAVVFVVLYYLWFPHALINGYGAHNFDEILYEIHQPYFSDFALIIRNLGLLVVIAVFSSLGASAYAWAINLAQTARVERDIVTAMSMYRQQAEQQLLSFLEEVKSTFAAQARGHMQLLQTRPATDPLCGIVLFLNEQLEMLAAQRKRPFFSGAETIEQELDHLLLILDAMSNGTAQLDALNKFAPSTTAIRQLKFLLYKIFLSYKTLSQD